MPIVIAIKEQRFPTGFARFLSSLMVTFLPPYDLGVFRFVCFIEIRNRCAINVIAIGILSVNAPMLFVLAVINKVTLKKNARTLQDFAFVKP